MNSDEVTNARLEVCQRKESILKDAKSQDNAEGSTKPKLRRGSKPLKLEQMKEKDEVNTQENVNAEKMMPSKPGRKRKEKASSPKAAEVEVETRYTPEWNQSDVAAKTMVVSESSPRVDASTNPDCQSIGCLVEPDSLGPCDPGTHVCLEGIVWQETCNGVLVVNVTWKGKTYIGTLLDATKHDWAPPSDSDIRRQNGRSKRSRISPKDPFMEINERKLRKEIRMQSVLIPANPYSKPDGSNRKSRFSECEAGEPSQKRGRTASQSSTQLATPPLMECPAPNCGKKFKQKSGLKYHQSHAHQDAVSNRVSEESDTESKLESTTSPKSNEKKVKAQCASRSRSDRSTELSGSKVESSVPVKGNTEAAHDSYNHTDDSRDAQFKSTSTKPAEDSKRDMEVTQLTSVATSVITSTLVAQPSTTSVPVVTIIPQVAVITMAGEKDILQNKPALPPVSPLGRPQPSGPPKLLPKSSPGSGMAPISTLSSQLNSSLKPIQPKPTILGDLSQSHTLTDLQSNKKIKRKSYSCSEDVALGTDAAKPLMSSVQTDIHNLNQTVQRMELESEKLDVNPECNASTFKSQLLQSPSYSKVSDEGHLKNSQGLQKNISNYNEVQQKGALKKALPIYGTSSYLVAAVSPQKSFTDKIIEPTSSINPPSSLSSPIIRAEWEEVRRQREHRPFSTSSFNATINDDMLRWNESSHANVSGSGKLSPNPSKDADIKATCKSTHTLQEKTQIKSQMPSSISEGSPKDYSMSSGRASGELSKLFNMQEQKLRDQEKLEIKKDPIHNQRRNPTDSPELSNKDDGFYDRLHHIQKLPSPLQGLGGMYPFMPHLHTGYAGPSGAGHVFPPNGFPSIQNVPFPFGVPTAVMKESSLHSFNPFGGKPSHKIHELQDVNRTSKSPKSSSSDRERTGLSSHPNKNQPVISPMFNPYVLSGMLNASHK